MAKSKRVAQYVRVSTDDQTVENQLRELQTWAQRCGHDVVRVFQDRGVNGAKGRDKRPGFDAMLKAAVRREFDMLAVWSSDRLGRSLQHLIEVLQTIRDTSCGLLHPHAGPRYDHTKRPSHVRYAGCVWRVREGNDCGPRQCRDG